MANTVTTYSGEGQINVHVLLRSIVQDLTGANASPESGPAKSYFNVISPTTLDLATPFDVTQPYLVILESTLNIDPFNATDPWRIAFQLNNWKDRTALVKVGASPNPVEKPDQKDIFGMAVYLGTASTLALDNDNNPVTAWNQSSVQTPQYYYNHAAFDPGKVDFSSYQWPSYKGVDFVEPPGNTGARWTNTFDITEEATRYNKPTPYTGKPAFYTSPQTWDGPNVTDPGQLFVNRWAVAGPKTVYLGQNIDTQYSVPMSYRITCTDHGLFLSVWGPDPEESGKNYSWLLAQRPVDKKTGIVRGLTTPINNAVPGNRPLFCVNSTNNAFYKFVVREHDLGVPSARKDATLNSDDSGAVINPYQQQSLTENGEYVITFLNNLNTSRFKYADELDMVGTVSADVVGGGADITVNVYGEKVIDAYGQAKLTPRRYHAMWAHGSFGTKMRIMVIAENTNPNPPPALV